MLRALVFTAALLASLTAWGQDNGDLISRETARRFGLERMWFTQVAVDPGQGQILHVTQHISNKRARFIYDLLFDEQTVQVTSTDLDAYGVPLGPEGAKAKADKIKQRLEAQGKTVEIVENSIPQITLVVTTSRGGVDVIDAETGKRYWAGYVGDPDHPTMAPAVDDDHVAVVNGSFVYLLDRETGELIWRRKTLNIPGAGPGINKSYVFVPMFNGMLESFDVKDPSQAIGVYRAVGRSLIQPAVTARSVVWPTDRGYMYVAPADRVGVRFRVEAKKTIVATPAHAGRNLYIPSIDGYIYCVDELTGGMLWTVSIGEPLGRQPVAVLDRLYVPSVQKNLYCLSLDDGSVLWSANGIDQVLTVGSDRLFCVGTAGNLVTLSLETGSVLMSAPDRLPEFRVTNSITNRLFLATPAGLMQGLREVSQPTPIVHFPEDPSAQPVGEQQPMTTTANPFGETPDAEAMPAGTAEGEAAAGAADPFGDDAGE